tara:strand:- start:1952 stop:2575 length:624 start_codon:yes stop_codon:yes gene_type:complete
MLTMGYKNQFKRKTRRIATSPHMLAAMGFKTNQKKVVLSAKEPDFDFSAENVLRTQIGDLKSMHAIAITKLKEKHEKQFREAENQRKALEKINTAEFQNLSARVTFLENDLDESRKGSFLLAEKNNELKIGLNKKQKQVLNMLTKYNKSKIEGTRRQALLLTAIRRAAGKNRAMSDKLASYEQNKFKALYRKLASWFKKLFKRNKTK